MVKVEDVKALKVPELREELKALGLDTKGVKADLVKRLEEALSSKSSAVPQQAAANAPASISDAGSAPTGGGAGTGRIPIAFKSAMAAEPKNQQAAIPPAAGEEKATIGQTDAEKRKQRAERFGVEPSHADKLKARAERFGTVSKTPATNGAANGKKATAPLSEAQKAEDLEKKKERAKRFNLPAPLTEAEAVAKKKARVERFGGSAAAGSSASSAELQKKLAARAERFALTAKKAAPEVPGKPAAVQSEAEAKRQARAIRFAAS